MSGAKLGASVASTLLSGKSCSLLSKSPVVAVALSIRCLSSACVRSALASEMLEKSAVGVASAVPEESANSLAAVEAKYGTPSVETDRLVFS